MPRMDEYHCPLPFAVASAIVARWAHSLTFKNENTPCHRTRVEVDVGSVSVLEWLQTQSISQKVRCRC